MSLNLMMAKSEVHLIDKTREVILCLILLWKQRFRRIKVKRHFSICQLCKTSCNEIGFDAH